MTYTSSHGCCALQILALVAMEKPVSLSADDIRDEKVKVLRCLQVVEKSDVIIGQHTAANGTPGYLEDEGVPDDSTTPTFAAMCLRIDNDRCVQLVVPSFNACMHANFSLWIFFSPLLRCL